MVSTWPLDDGAFGDLGKVGVGSLVYYSIHQIGAVQLLGCVGGKGSGDRVTLPVSGCMSWEPPVILSSGLTCSNHDRIIALIAELRV